MCPERHYAMQALGCSLVLSSLCAIRHCPVRVGFPYCIRDCSVDVVEAVAVGRDIVTGWICSLHLAMVNARGCSEGGRCAVEVFELPSARQTDSDHRMG